MKMKTKKNVAIILAVMTMTAMTGCATRVNAMDNEEIMEVTDTNVTIDEITDNEDPLSDDMIEAIGVEVCGGWSVSENSEITEDIQAVFDKAIEGLTGVDYTPVAYLGSQVVAGMNHAILCRATVVVPDAKPYYTIMYIYEDLDGNATIQSFSDIDLILN